MTSEKLQELARRHLWMHFTVMGCFQRIRKICDEHGIMLVSDEVICAFGRLGHMFDCVRFDYLPGFPDGTFPRGRQGLQSWHYLCGASGCLRCSVG